MNGRLTDGTTAGDLILLQAQTEPQTQNLFYFSHGHTLLGHEVSSTCQWSRLRPAGVQRRLLRLRRLHKIIPACEYRFRAESICVPHPAGIRIHIAPESLFTISRNAYSHAPHSAVGCAPVTKLWQSCPGGLKSKYNVVTS